MTEVDERLLTAAKLAEAIDPDGNLPDAPHLDRAVGVPADRHRRTMGWLERSLPDPWDTALGSTMLGKSRSDAAQAALEGDPDLAAYLVGVTDRDLVGSALRFPLQVARALRNGGAPCYATALGNPNSGKTNTMSLLAELALELYPDSLVLSNVGSWSAADRTVTSMYELTVALLEERIGRGRPIIVLLDELSTHFDSRTNSRAVAHQYTPVAKRYAKLGVELEAGICHTGKDLHPERKRLNTLAVQKHEKTEAEFFDSWPADSDRPTDPLFAGSVTELEPTTLEYDPDDAAPWAWDLDPGLFSADLSWSELHAQLLEEGPVE